MVRELILSVLVLLVCGPIALASSALPALAKSDGSGRALERVLWARLWAPLLPAVLAFACLLGWAIQETDYTEEYLHDHAFALAVPFALILGRAIARSGWALLARRCDTPIATVGLIRPRLVLAPSALEAMDPGALLAACEHEAAHRRHLDPLRIWLGQIASELQWPWPSAKLRLRNWLWALEVARDEEAREHGADGADLATAILTVARLSGTRRPSEAAGLAGDGARLKERIRRLLSPIPDEPPTRRGWLTVQIVLVGLSAAILMGVHHGDLVVRRLPGVHHRAPDTANDCRDTRLTDDGTCETLAGVP